MKLIDAKAVEWKVEQLLQYRYEDYGMMFGPGLEILNIIRNAPTIGPKPNNPLTLDELREMCGEPVWCEKFEWRICYGVSDFRGCLCMETGAGSCIQLNDYGKTWRAYRCRPEEGG